MHDRSQGWAATSRLRAGSRRLHLRRIGSRAALAGTAKPPRLPAFSFLSRLGEWVLARLLHPPPAPVARSLVALALLLVGLLDAWSGVRVSLSAFYFFTVALAVIWVGARLGVITAAAATVLRQLGNWAAGDWTAPPAWDWWNASMMLLVALAEVWIVHHFVTLHRRLEQRVQERTEALEHALQERRTLARELLGVSARERNAMGHELHDDLCQHLVGTALAAKVLSQQVAPAGPAAVSGVDRVVALVEAGVGKTRRLARGLLLASIEPARLPEELRELAQTSAREGVQCRFAHSGAVPLTEPTAAAQVFRIVQEAVRNALRHSGCRRIEIVMDGDPAALVVTITDDGSGLPPADARRDGMGLRIMTHRATFIGGALTFTAPPHGGTCVMLRVPATASSAS